MTEPTRSSEFGFGFVCGYLLGAMLFVSVAIYLRDRGRDDCDAQLPRDKSCVQKWVPPAEGRT